MAAVLAIQTVATVLLGVLVVGLLRSHAEILRTLHQLSAGLEAAPRGATAGAAAPARRSASTGFDVAGSTTAGEAVRFGVVGASESTLLAFLSSGCVTCGVFWDTVAAGDRLAVPGGARLVIVTKGPEAESPSRVRELSPAAVPVVMSTAAWLDYKVPHTPYFVHVDGPTGRILGEGTAATWAQVGSLPSPVVSDVGGGDGENQGFLPPGIRPGRRSLYPPPREQA